MTALKFESPPKRITRLPFKLMDFTRVIWVSEMAKQVWEPRIRAITSAWDEMEVRAAESGLRPGALKFIAPEHLPILAARGAKRGLVVVPLAREGASGSYSATVLAVADGQAWHYRTAYCRPGDAETWIKAWETSDDETIGMLLGYPECCRKFFRHFWVQERYVDTTYPMSLGGTDGPTEANHLLRWLGIRLVPHLPHAHDCVETIRQANEYLDFGRGEGYGREMDWMLEMLSWPVEWSALHGIAEIRLPILKISTRTDSTAHKVVVRRRGTGYPAEGARGVQFPYLPPTGVQLTKGRSFQKSMARLELEWIQNGFGSRDAMERAHAVVVDAIREPIAAGLVVDLGCGNGRLLEEVLKRVPGGIPGGMDAERERALDAKRRLQNGDFAFGNIHDESTWPRGHYSLALIYPGRLLEEQDPVRRAATLQRLMERSDRILCYSYSDNLVKQGVVELARAAGIEGTTGPVSRTPDGEAVMIAPVRTAGGQHGDVPHGDVHGDHTDQSLALGVAPIGRPKEMEEAVP